MRVGQNVLRGVLSTVECLPVPAYALDTEGVVLAWNRALARMTGVAGEELIGRGGGAHAVPFIGSSGCMLADLVIDPARSPPPHLSEIERDGDGHSARLAAELSGVGCALAVRATPIVAEGATIGAIEVVLAPHAAEPDTTASRETVARLVQTARHDVKNELTIVLGYIALARDTVADPTACLGLDRAVVAAGRIGALLDLARDLGEWRARPPENRNLEYLIRTAADRADLGGIELEIDLSQATVTADPVVFGALEHLFDRLFAYSATTVPRPAAIRIGTSATEPSLIAYEDDARRADPRTHLDRYFADEPDRELVMLRDVLSLDGIGLSVVPDPLRLELNVPGLRVRSSEKKE